MLSDSQTNQQDNKIGFFSHKQQPYQFENSLSSVSPQRSILEAKRNPWTFCDGPAKIQKTPWIWDKEA